MDLEAALADVDQAIYSTEQKIENLVRRLEALRDERRGLELAFNRHQLGGQIIAPSSQNDEWQKMPRSDAVERVLKEANEPLSPVEITNRLRATGRGSDTDSYVSAALSYLRKEGRVYRVGRGQWVAGKNPLPMAVAGLAAGAAGLSLLSAAAKEGAAAE